MRNYWDKHYWASYPKSMESVRELTEEEKLRRRKARRKFLGMGT